MQNLQPLLVPGHGVASDLSLFVSSDGANLLGLVTVLQVVANGRPVALT